MDLLDIQRRVKIESISPDFSGNFIGLSYDSRQVRPGDIYVAIKGEVVDGHAFIDEAKRRGAIAACVEDSEGCRLPYIQVQDTRAALASLSALFYSDPSKELEVIGITGTKGKTTVAWMLGHLLKHAGRKCAVMGTLGLIRQNGKVIDFNLTTPASLDIQREMRKLVDEGYDSIVLEVTAHGIHLKRVLEVHFDYAVFTNIGQDHLDYFKWDDYIATKRRFFEDTTQSKVKEGLAILNADDDYFSSSLLEDRLNRLRVVRVIHKNTVWNILGTDLLISAGNSFERAVRICYVIQRDSHRQSGRCHCKKIKKIETA